MLIDDIRSYVNLKVERDNYLKVINLKYKVEDEEAEKEEDKEIRYDEMRYLVKPSDELIRDLKAFVFDIEQEMKKVRKSFRTKFDVASNEELNSLLEEVKKEKENLKEEYRCNKSDDAKKMAGINGENLLRLLESRLDNLVYRIGFAATRRGARQLVNHGHVTVNGKKVDVPSYRCKVGDVISLKDKDKELKVVKESLEKVVSRVEFVTFDQNKMEGTFVRLPERHELNAEIDEAQIVEYYNRMD